MRPSELVTGNCYFSLGYADQDLAIPLIQTLVYVGPEDDPENGRRLWTFRDPSLGGAAAGGALKEEDVRVVFPEEQLHMILDLDGLMRTLSGVATEHPLHPIPADPGPASDADLAGLTTEIERFFASAGLESVTITIRFTDQGFSVSRRPNGTIDLLLFPQGRVDHDRERVLRELCLSAGLTPSQDYLCNHGQTRVLVYAVPSGSAPTIAKLASRMFLEAYGMRHGDSLRYQSGPDRSEHGG